MYSDLVAITPEQYFKQITKRLAEIKAVSVSVVTEEYSSQSADTRITVEDNLCYRNHVSSVVE